MTEMADFLVKQADSYSDDVSFRLGGIDRSYPQLLEDSLGLARGLVSVGIGPGDRVAVFMDNSLEAVIAWFALTVVGCTEIPLNTNYRGRLLRNLLEDSLSEVVILDSKYGDVVVEAMTGLDRIRRVVTNGETESSSPDWMPLSDLTAAGNDQIALDKYDGGEVVLYTSGTTGMSKGVVHGQRSCILLAEYVAEVCRYTSSDRLLNFFPLYHQNARYTGVLAAIAAGASIDLEKAFTSSGFWDLCRAREITAFNYLGSVLQMIRAASGQVDKIRDRDHPVRLGWGAGASAEERLEFANRFRVELVEVYGLSEAPMATVNIPGSGCDPGSAGVPSKFFEVKILDETGSDLPHDVAGDIALRPKVNGIFTKGYFNNDSATVAATQDLWFHTGDRGFLSASGELFFVERAKDSLRRRGENISAWEVESILNADPLVREAAVYGVPGYGGEEEVMVALVLVEPTADVGDIVRRASRHLPKYAVPRFVRAMADLPRTPTQKVQKQVLRDAGVTAETLDLAQEEGQ